MTDVTDSIQSELMSHVAIPGYLRNLRPLEKITPNASIIMGMVDGWRLSFISRAVIYDQAMRRLDKNQHKMLIRLILGGHIRVMRELGPLPNPHKNQIGSDGMYHYILTTSNKQ